jgi:hypothetical protein
VVSAADPPRSLNLSFRPEPLIFLKSSSSFILTRLSGPRSRPTATQKKSDSAGNRSRDLWGLQRGILTTRPQGDPHASSTCLL